MAAGDGEVFKLGSPASGELVIRVDAAKTGGAFVMYTQTLPPGARMPSHRHRDRHTVLSVYKGQGRVILDRQTINVVPGVTLFIPRQSWHSLRNTGTGLLYVAWISTPPGVEALFRDLAGLTDLSDFGTLQRIAERHGVEFQPETEPPARTGAPRRRGRRRRPPQAARPTSAAQSQPASQPAEQGAGRRRRRRRRPPGVSAAKPVQTSRGGSSAPAKSKEPARGDRPRGGHRGRVKEIYVEGRWVKVSGDTPFIPTGRADRSRKSGRPKDDHDYPTGPLAVPL